MGGDKEERKDKSRRIISRKKRSKMLKICLTLEQNPKTLYNGEVKRDRSAVKHAIKEMTPPLYSLVEISLYLL